MRMKSHEYRDKEIFDRIVADMGNTIPFSAVNGAYPRFYSEYEGREVSVWLKEPTTIEIKSRTKQAIDGFYNSMKKLVIAQEGIILYRPSNGIVLDERRPKKIAEKIRL